MIIFKTLRNFPGPVSTLTLVGSSGLVSVTIPHFVTGRPLRPFLVHSVREVFVRIFYTPETTEELKYSGAVPWQQHSNCVSVCCDICVVAQAKQAVIQMPSSTISPTSPYEVQHDALILNALRILKRSNIK